MTLTPGQRDGDVLDRDHPPKCRDFDEDCDDVSDKVHCYLHDPAKGYCPFLRLSGGHNEGTH